MADSWISPVSISLISRSSNVVSVTTATAHGLAVGQAVDIQGATDTTLVGVFYVVSVGSTTTFTFNSTGANSSGTAGTAGPARQMFALGIGASSPGISTLQVIFWYPISSPVPKASFTSAVPSTIPHPPTARDQSALLAGILVEESVFLQIPSSWAQGAKLSATEQYIQDYYSGRLAALNALPQPGAVEGYWYDGTGWQQ
jgi:hypothetical protein